MAPNPEIWKRLEFIISHVWEESIARANYVVNLEARIDGIKHTDKVAKGECDPSAAEGVRKGCERISTDRGGF